MAAYKRPSEADASKNVRGAYLYGDWVPVDVPRQPLPAAVDMVSLYRELLRALMPLPARRGESLQDQLDRLARVRAAERECARLQAQLEREQQFTRKVEVIRHLREARQTLRTTQAVDLA